MSESIFDGLSFYKDGNRIQMTYPEAIVTAVDAAPIAGVMELDITSTASGSWSVEFGGNEVDATEQAKQFFCRLHSFPATYGKQAGQRPAASPDISCVIVLNENLRFVEEQLLPSIHAHSGQHQLEIIVVWNGNKNPGSTLSGCETVASEWGAVAKAYNCGVQRSNAPLIAIFHDDCIIDDSLWIEKCMQRLEAGADVVAAEIRHLNEAAGVTFPPIPVAKSVPLVMRKDTFEEVGGFDEYHYAGFEDLDFTLSLLRANKQVVTTNLDIRHFNGMSSTLKYHPSPQLEEIYALAALPGNAIIKRFVEFIKVGLRQNDIDYLSLAMDAQLLYLLNKHRDFLGEIDPAKYKQGAAALEHRITTNNLTMDEATNKFRELDIAFQLGNPGSP